MKKATNVMELMGNDEIELQEGDVEKIMKNGMSTIWCSKRDEEKGELMLVHGLSIAWEKGFKKVVMECDILKLSSC
ncbi:hypothetical protein J1N35_018679 [Gossypium stocksii]|uniref:Uncharacterized protein n=1 Tax=Gossypium stocksii TaxID=47602 RepID=A0A9D3VQT2_9ROSI|nr:hypothetical protein J1N35_018679 [Gossypium stocksii]